MSSNRKVGRTAARILIAEDSPTQAQELVFLLEEYGFQVTAARNGKEALALICKEHPDLIISDVMMPEMDGYSFCRAIKSDKALKEIPFVLVTSLSSPHDVFKGLDVGADNFIIKPYDADLLLSRIDYLLTNRDLRKSGKLQVGIEIELSGQRHFITAERQQILDLLISTYEQAVRLYDELDVRQRELARSYETLNALYGVAEGLNRCRTESEIALSAVERGLTLPGVRAGWIYLFDDDTFRLAASKGVPESILADGPICRDCNCQKLLRSRDVTASVNVAECERLAKLPRASELRYHASVPLFIDGQAKGLLNLVGTEQRMFSDEELRTLSSIGNQIAVALERARLHESLERKVEQRTTALQAEVAERRQAEKAAREVGEHLREANETLSTILDSTPLPTITLDQSDIVLSWNQAAEDIFGYAARDVIGKINPLSSDIDLKNDPNALALQSGRVVRGWNTKLRHADGTLIELLVSGGPLYDKMRAIRGSVLTLEDIRERRRVEEQLRQAQKMEAIGNLTGGIAHDFNNLLAIIIGNIDLLSGSIREDDRMTELLEGALQAGLRGADLTRQLLAFGRRQTLKPEHVDVNRLVAGMVKLLMRTLGAQVRTKLIEGGNLWPVVVDAAQLDSAIVNLAVNARDAMPEGGVLTIETMNVDVDDSVAEIHPGLLVGEYVTISVTDTGTGMPPEIIAHVFEPFFTTKETNKGTGLGLAMVYGFVKQSGGHITVYSEVGAGTTFRMYLPRATEGATAAKAADSPDPEGARGTESVLVVEDNEAVRRMATRQLADLGYRVSAADSAASALVILERDQQIDVVFSDVVMPGEMSGIKLAHEISRRWPSIRVLLTSGFPETALNQTNGEIRAKILSKPYRNRELARSMRELLER